MTRRRKPANKPSRTAKPSRQDRELAEVAEAVHDATKELTSTTDLAMSLAERCDDYLDDLDFDAAYTDAALALWRAAASSAAHELVALLTEYAAEQQRHARALVSLRDRLDAVGGREDHEQLEPFAECAKIVFHRLFVASAASLPGPATP